MCININIEYWPEYSFKTLLETHTSILEPVSKPSVEDAKGEEEVSPT